MSTTLVTGLRHFPTIYISRFAQGRLSSGPSLSHIQPDTPHPLDIEEYLSLQHPVRTEVPHFETYLSLMRCGLQTDSAMRKHYVSVFRKERAIFKHSPEVTAEEDASLYSFFSNHFPEICLYNQCSKERGLVAAQVRRAQGFPNIIWIPAELAIMVERALYYADIGTVPLPLARAVIITLATLYHELSHSLVSHLNLSNRRYITPEHVRYPIVDSEDDLSEEDVQGESGSVVEASLFGGILAWKWLADEEDKNWENIEVLMLYREEEEVGFAHLQPEERPYLVFESENAYLKQFVSAHGLSEGMKVKPQDWTEPEWSLGNSIFRFGRCTEDAYIGSETRSIKIPHTTTTTEFHLLGDIQWDSLVWVAATNILDPRTLSPSSQVLP